MKNYERSANYLKNKYNYSPSIGIILGSGLGDIEEFVKIENIIPYNELPFFPQSTAEGHKGNLIFGEINNTKVVIQQGRFHFYEGYSNDLCVFGVRVMKLLGIDTLFVTNAVGAVNPNYKVGDLMFIRDHINLLPNPLIGQNDNSLGTRFPDMTRPYEQELITKAEQIAIKNDIRYHKGVLFSSTGPSFETPAEYNFFKIIGADVVGMSTTNEVIAARHCGLKVLGISIITNEAFNFADDFTNSGADVLVEASKAARKMFKIFSQIIA